MSQTNTPPLIEVNDLSVRFAIRRGAFRSIVGHIAAVDGVSFEIHPGATLGLVGESGCGKTTVAHAMLKLIPVDSGSVRFNGQNVFDLSVKELRSLRRQMQIVFQDPYGSLNPKMTAGDIVGEGLRIHKICRGKELRRRVGGLLERVGLSADHFDRYPDEFSGGQRQRIGIARALALEPRFIVCDEAVSSLDVSVQAQVLNLLMDLQREFGLSYLFISHDLSVIRQVSDRVAVMYLGRIVEMGDAEQLLNHPAHPYTQALMNAIPVPDPDAKRTAPVLAGEVPSAAEMPSGCPFHPRCPNRQSDCDQNDPEWRWFGERGRHGHRCVLDG